MKSTHKQPKVELCKELSYDEDGYFDTWFIRKGTHRNFCVCDSLDEKDLEKLYTKIGRVLKKVDWKKEYKKDLKKYL